jgi:nucleoside 2-deoxyribosyltransferase
MECHETRVYLAGPLFSEAEKNFNKQLRDLLSSHCSVYLPQDDGGLLVEMVTAGIPPTEATTMIFQKDIEEVKKCDIFLIILDGRTVDEGACVELGLAFGLNKECVGLQTDPRRLLSFGNNPMITGALHRTFHSVDEVVGFFSAASNRYQYLRLAQKKETKLDGAAI